MPGASRREPERRKAADHDHREQHGEHALVALEETQDRVPGPRRRPGHRYAARTRLHTAIAQTIAQTVSLRAATRARRTASNNPEAAAVDWHSSPPRTRGRRAAPSPPRTAVRRSGTRAADRPSRSRTAPIAPASRGR